MQWTQQIFSLQFSGQHIRTLLLSWESIVSHMDTPFSPFDPHQQAVSPPSTITQKEPQAAASAAPVSPAVIREQEAAGVDLLHLPTIDPFQDH